MASSSAELSALLTQVRELGERVGQVGEGLNQSPTEDVASALFEAERALRTAVRAVERGARLLG